MLAQTEDKELKNLRQKKKNGAENFKGLIFAQRSYIFRAWHLRLAAVWICTFAKCLFERLKVSRWTVTLGARKKKQYSHPGSRGTGWRHWRRCYIYAFTCTLLHRQCFDDAYLIHVRRLKGLDVLLHINTTSTHKHRCLMTCKNLQCLPYYQSDLLNLVNLGDLGRISPIRFITAWSSEVGGAYWITAKLWLIVNTALVLR